MNDPFKTFELAAAARKNAYDAFMASFYRNDSKEIQDELFAAFEAADEQKVEAEQEWAYARGAIR